MQRAKAFFVVCGGIFLLALSYHLGAGRASAQSGLAPEAAILTGTVLDGGTIPLPQYSDGTEAMQSECRWIVSINTASAGAPGFNGVWCYTTGRVVAVGAAGNGASHGTANYLIIATRTSGPVSVQPRTLGEVKARYR